MTPARPTPAKGGFPYAMRTVAEVDASVRAQAKQFVQYRAAGCTPVKPFCEQCQCRVNRAAAVTCVSRFCPFRENAGLRRMGG